MELGAPRLAALLAQLDPSGSAAGYCVALSGGLDSNALLHLMAALGRRGAGPGLRAIHVNHGLQAQAGEWAEICRRRCQELEVPLEVVDLALQPARGASVEAAARDARYAALARLLRPGEWLLTAHHRDDQLETVLIQLLRGAGVDGLAAMPALAKLGSGWHARPLLEVDRVELQCYATQQRLTFVQDPMNAATRYDRGWLRERVLPAIRERWPAAATTVARSALHLAQASRLLAELAAADAAGLVAGGRLAIDGLQRLAQDRQVNLLRWWIHSRGLGPPPTTRLATALRDLSVARVDAQPLVQWPDGELRRYRGRLYAMHPLDEPPSGFLRFDPALPAGIELGGGLGRISLAASDQGGLDPALSQDLVIRFRTGGESLRPHPARPRKRLNQLCQEAGIVPWMRPRLPLVFIGSRLAAVGDLWIDADLAVAPGLPALAPVWLERPGLY